MKRKTDAAELPRACEVCRIGRPAPDGEHMLCPKHGVVARDSCCRAFRYDPLKRVPRRRPELPTFSKEEFEL